MPKVTTVVELSLLSYPPAVLLDMESSVRKFRQGKEKTREKVK